MSDVLEQARAFQEEDPDEAARAELEGVLARAQAGDASALADLRDRFTGGLSFGTAGLRGAVGAGQSRMNRVVVMKATHALGSWLLSEPGLEACTRGVVVGFDGRYSSRQFAEDTAAVLAGLGIPAHVFPDPVPTPLCSFAVPRLRAAAGVMVTASHNPPADNGYKVYQETGGQILPPVDGDIASRMARAPRVPDIARLSPPAAAAAGLRLFVSDEIEAAYLDGLARSALHPAEKVPSLRIAYTAMHGVGHRLLARALRRAGFDGVAAEPAQTDPDGAFRTVAFPNPEEKGAMDRVLAVAKDAAAELVLANDPDADRLAVAVPAPGGQGYRMLSGNEIGVLLADDALAHADTGGRPKLVLTTVVSSTLLSRMARDRGAVYGETLTGFKWIGDAAIRGEAQGQAFVFGYEEALGYTVGPLVRDKDGIGAALRMAELVRFLKSGGKTLLQRLDELLVAHGMSHQVQWSLTLQGTGGRARIDAVMAALRESPPDRIGESPIIRTLDAERGLELTPEGTRPSALPRADVLAYYAEDGGRLIVRPSGTEPKIKFYLELVGQAKDAGAVAGARADLDRRGLELKARLLSRLGLA
ncbi:MAG TPA: phospho-sugar mutase [Vicinamibacteria bacterium]|nr:phospho-sugar mutase [Vicinamibacteria bacterium]